jgi:hypothetical protein
MPITDTTPDAVVAGAATLPILQFFAVTNSASNPAYLVVCALDRDEYTVASNGDTGSFTGNGVTLGLHAIGDDGRGCGIVFTWQPGTGHYVNATYGTLNALTYTASDSPDDITNISLFGTSNAALAQQDASNAYALMHNDASGYLGSATIATQPGFTGIVPAAATPDGVAAAAMGFVGDAWNMDGCWVLASMIAAEAGSSLPVQSTAVGMAGKPNGEWIPVYNGPVNAHSNWQALVTTGDIVVFTPAGGGGHITTCVSGTGSTAMLVDNATFVNAQGGIVNSANDGSAADILIAAPHLAQQEFSGVAASSVVIYALDTPVIADTLKAANLLPGKSLSFATLFTASDPGGKTITQFQAYDSLTGDSIIVNGQSLTAHSAASAVTAHSLSALGLLSTAANSSGADTIDIRGYNGSYWGDWQSFTVSLNPQAPVLGPHTPNQTWAQCSQINLVLPATLFSDPQGSALRYSASGAGGTALPGWLRFSAATRAFTGTVPAGVTTFAVMVTAVDALGLSCSETFGVTVPAVAPVVTDKESALHWDTGSAISSALPADSFTDKQGQTLVTTASLANGAALPAWLAFSGATMRFTGTAPDVPQTLSLKITATDTSLLSASEIFSVTIADAVGGIVLPADWGAPAPGVPPADPVYAVPWHSASGPHMMMLTPHG